MKIFLYLLIAVVAIGFIVVNVLGIDGKADNWDSLLLGVIVGLLILKGPSLITYFKARRQKAAK